jgi:hypothetical protein
VTPAKLPPSVKNAAEREETLKAQAEKQCWHHFSVAPQAVLTQRTHAQGAVVQNKEQSRHTHEHEQGNQYRTTRKPLPRTTTTGQARKGWLVSNPLRADIGTTADTANLPAHSRKQP